MEKKNHQDKVVKIGRRGFIGGGLAAGVGCFLGGNMLPAPSEAIPVGRHVMRKKVRPVLVGDWWLIGRAPTEHLQPQGGKKIEPVDHHLFKGSDGHWHLWGCVRNTEVGRVLYHWQAADLTDSP